MQLFSEEVTKESSIGTNVQHTQQTEHKMNKFYPPKPKINAFNALFTCYLCQGYMINPTTIDVCMHTYCRSCIARYLAGDCYCPQCKNSDGKIITISNLKPDDILRSVIFKLVPGLYQKERERLVQFVNKNKNEGNLIGSTQQSLSKLLEVEDDLFSPTDPISLSLEYHPVLVEDCPVGAVPPMRYLQCPANVKVQHLKRFLCSKFDIDPSNKRIGIDIIYDDEVLPSDFTLMDVSYCYKWERHAPLRFTYRILIYDEDLSTKSDKGYIAVNKVSDSCSKSCLEKSLPTECSSKSVTFAEEKTQISINGDIQLVKAKSLATSMSPMLAPATKFKSAKSVSSKHSPNSSVLEAPVKVTFSRKSSDGKKTFSKKSSSADEFVTATTNDFKSLRSNDIRYSDYAITSSTTNNVGSSNNNNSSLTKNQKILMVKEDKPTKCEIVVSIPHNQMQEQWESKPLSHLKTACKKSPNSSSMESATVPAKKVRNVPKLKIELNSLKSKLIEKPKSADIRLDTLMGKYQRHRKLSLDEPHPISDKVDLETYVKNIGLKPIQIATQNASESEVADKFTPNASPMSSSSSTTSSSTGNFNFNSSTNLTTSSSSSSHKKRKKKHSKDSRESKDSKRKKMHAEISSHSAEESLKMKVKLTPPINMKSLLESKKSPPVSTNKCADPLAFEKPKSPGNRFVMTFEKKEFEKPQSAESKGHDRSKNKSKSRNSEAKKTKSSDSKTSTEIKKFRELERCKPLEIKIVTKSAAKDFDDDEDVILTETTTSSVGIGKSLATIKETNLPHSPPLPPSLFKTTPLTFSTFSPNVTAVAKPKAHAMPKESKDKPKTTQIKAIAPKPIAAKPLPPPSSASSSLMTTKSPQFAVPNPPRFLTTNSAKFLSTPTSIASAANKHMGNLLKRSMSLDENKTLGSASKQARIEKPNQITVSAYGSNLHMTKVEIPATPTSSTAKATFEIPLYSPLSASYNPKCSFSVNTSTAVAKAAKVSIKQQSANSIATPVPAYATAKQMFTTNNAAATNKTEPELIKKTTANDIKCTSNATITTTNIRSIKNNNNNNNNKSTTLMGPPLPLQKLNSGLTVVPTAVKSPPLSTVLPFTAVTKTPHTAVLNTAYLSSPLSMVKYRQSKVLIAHAKPTPMNEFKNETTTTKAATTTTTNGLATTEKPKSTLRQFRLPSRDSVQDILDLSAASANAASSSSNGTAEMKTSTSTMPIMATTAGSTLEMALNKIKQNMTTTNSSMDNAIKKQELSPISDDLQNLHMLSESATAREKIAISSATAATTTVSSSSLYEKPKINQNTMVRQQNASVRNIPNPSALAFRNQQPNIIMPPMVTIAAAALATIPKNDNDKSLILKQPSPPKSPQSPSCCTTSSSTSPVRNASKKHPSIDQVAASLNMRASAAAQASAKAISKHSENSSMVTSTSSTIFKEIKQEATEVTQSETTTTQQSSEVATKVALEIVEIKKEPEEKMPETQIVDTTQLKTVFPILNTKKPSKVENLVTSVINVTSPTTTTLLTASNAGY